MFYRFDVNKFIIQLLPPVLRKKSIYAFLRCFLYPLQQLQSAFEAYKQGVDRQLASCSFENYLERFLNGIFFFDYRAIYITDVEKERAFLAFSNEAVDPVYLSYQSESPSSALRLSSTDPDEITGSFIVHVPAAFSAADIATVTRWVNFYKMAGTEFSVQTYE